MAFFQEELGIVEFTNNIANTFGYPVANITDFMAREIGYDEVMQWQYQVLIHIL